MTPAAGSDPPVALRRWADLPGPRGWPLLGNVRQVDRDRMHQSLEAWAARYGPVFRVRFGWRRILVVADPELAVGVLRDRPNGFGRTDLLQAVTSEMGVTGVFSANGEVWRVQRRMVAAAFDGRHLQDYFPHLVAVTARYQRHWQGLAEAGTRFDLGADLLRFTVDVVAGLAFGVDLDTIGSQREDAIQTRLQRIFPALQRRVMAPFPYWRYWPTAADRALADDLAEVRRAVQVLIDAARERLREDPAAREHPANLLDAMLVASAEADTSIDDQTIFGNVLTILLAGEDTTANTLAWLLHHVHQTPGLALALRAEADRVLEGAGWVTHPGQVGALGLTEACAHETLRLRPAAPLQMLQAARDGVVAGVRVPKGGLVMLLTRYPGRDLQHFEQSAAFRPERWQDPQTGITSSRQERITLPFGGGPRLCPGRSLALMEIGMVVSMLFRNFDIVTLETDDRQGVREWMRFVLMPSRLWVRLRPRVPTPA